MKLLIRNQGLTRALPVPQGDPLSALADVTAQQAELIDERKACWKRAVFVRDGGTWNCVMDREGKLGPRPEETEAARDLPLDLCWVITDLARQERVNRGRLKSVPDWPEVVHALIDGQLLREDQTRLTSRGRSIALELIDIGY